MNLNKEKFAFKLFIEQYGKLPDGIKSERPDFIINHHGIKIGIELIELIELPEKNKVYLPKKYALEDAIVKLVQITFNNISDKRIVANLQFQDNLRVNSNNKKSFALEICNRIIDSIRMYPNIVYHNLEITDNLPHGLLNIYFDIAPFLEESIFQAMRGKWPAKFNCNDLNRLIIKKENNISSYLKNVDKIYLVITEGFIPNSWFGDFENIGTLVDNKFDKVFLLRVMSHKLFELK